MSIVKTLLMAAALALPVTTLSVIPAATSAEAAPAKKGKKVAKAKKVHVAKHKSCGTYMYWKGGKCNDGRLKAGKIV